MFILFTVGRLHTEVNYDMMALNELQLALYVFQEAVIFLQYFWREMICHAFLLLSFPKYNNQWTNEINMHIIDLMKHEKYELSYRTLVNKPFVCQS